MTSGSRVGEGAKVQQISMKRLSHLRLQLDGIQLISQEVGSIEANGPMAD